ncbi:E3 ubiquitin-protein ligase SH3RF3 [Anopheles ziemanni]|uniref:E3 ubiquitin-protein ligase SH3RF3 n=1 Tax=Anopheles coustani TaxID=139045 RepID=UPI0026586846|nr:E3 ubiquitin-protein ligase SH3RF3 [Anopheles coustani]XP_058116426.1 E3 ubiquitin-protein ligase SH3RF3 [Anopheles coustani]XP_058171314.1 E3 ubiquitin-protein ligase SH3RF3 [Anopheles ziemanni]
MDERLLNDLLECSVCLERLDSSSKVLPCQHTFCRKCLEEIVASHQELRCPECRVLVEVRIDELPPNVLLMRILEGMKTAELNSQNTNHQPSPGNNGKPTCNRNQSQGAAPNAGGGYHHHHQHQQHLHHQQHPSSGGAKMGKSMAHGGTGGSEQGPHQQQQHQHHHQPLSRIIASNAVTISSATTTTTTAASNAALDLSKIPHAKAFYDFSSSETSDISFRKGDIILLKKKIDHNWCVGEVNGKEGAVPLNHIKVIVPLPFPQCKALYDFRMGPSEEEGCLTFKKGALIHVLRRVDQNWAEGRIAEKIGIFPISFVEMNGLAKHLMDSSLKHLMGNNSNRTVPPTPFDLHASATSSSDTSSSVTTSPNSSTSTTSSNSSTAPSSPTAHFLQSQPSGATTVAPTASKPQSKQQHHRSDPANREKRHSLTTATFGMPNSGAGSAGSASTSVAGSGALQPNQPVAHRHSTEMLNSDTETARHPVPMAMADSPGSSSGNAAAASYQKCNLTKASQMYQAHPQLPTTYVALYPYKPQKPDELELKKGSIYYVTERCQDGWFKGTNWQKKSGVFPGNYVQIYKGREGAASGGRNANANSSGKLNNVSSPHSGSSAANGGGGGSAGAMNNSPNGGSSSPLQLPLQLPELPPRNTNQQQQQQQQQQGMKYIESIFGRQSSLDVGGGGSPSNDTPQHTTTGSDAATTTPPSSAAATGKVKKDSSAVSLMKRLTNMKRSKSPTGCSGGTANPAYTSDGSLFEETAGNGGGGKSSPSGSPASGAGPVAKPNFQQIVNPVHVRSGSCPSQLLQNLPMDLMMNGGGVGHGPHQQQQQQQSAQHHQQNPAFPSGMGRGENAPLMYGSQRIKPHKERPSMQGFKYGADHSVVTAMPKHIAHEAPASTSSSHMAAKQQTQIYHRKSQSLDASAIISQLGPSQHPNAQSASNGTPSKSSSSKSSHSQSVRERFKCIVPYPPNSEYELELRVGDIVMVHKKRDNGWYKGTHARSGKTGLFPASFVEPVDT